MTSLLTTGLWVFWCTSCWPAGEDPTRCWTFYFFAFVCVAQCLLVSPALRFQVQIQWKPTMSSWEASTWSSFQRKSPRTLPISSRSSAGRGRCLSHNSLFSSPGKVSNHSCAGRDNPSERLGNLKNGVKDIQKHKWVSCSQNILMRMTFDLSVWIWDKSVCVCACSGGLKVLTGRVWEKERWLRPSHQMWVEIKIHFFFLNRQSLKIPCWFLKFKTTNYFDCLLMLGVCFMYVLFS